jgi:DNA repair protein RadD
VSRLHPGKENGLILDFTNNTALHGPIDMITVDKDGEVKTAPAKVCEMCGAENEPRARKCEACGHVFVKDCPKCMAPVAKDARTCPECGHWFAVAREAKHNDKAYSGKIISDGEDEVWDVDDWRFARHKKSGRPDSMRVMYWIGLKTYSDWICFEHSGYAAEKAVLWWAKRGGEDPPPATVDEALERVGELRMPETVKLKKDGKYWRVIA